jgi:H+/Cl- antiporter ClcA
MDYSALLPALVAAIIGDMITRALGIHHTAYPQVAHLPLSWLVLLKLLVLAAAAAVTSVVFIELTHGLKKYATQYVPRLPWRMAIGGASVVVLYLAVDTDAYLGLGIPGIVGAFLDPSQPAAAFALKLLFTALTLSAGFLGGEVTPLFFVGAALGNTVAQLIGLPLAMGAGLGMAAVFASAANAPFALAVMAVELLGREALPHAAVVCVAAYLFSGHRSIYPSQRVERDKNGDMLTKPLALRDWHQS